MTQKKHQESSDICTLDKENYKLVLYNDHVNTFNFVINSLVEVCQLDFNQAETCTYVVHYKGKCIIKHGSYDYLRPMYESLSKKRLTAEII